MLGTQNIQIVGENVGKGEKSPWGTPSLFPGGCSLSADKLPLLVLLKSNYFTEASRATRAEVGIISLFGRDWVEKGGWKKDLR